MRSFSAARTDDSSWARSDVGDRVGSSTRAAASAARRVRRSRRLMPATSTVPVATAPTTIRPETPAATSVLVRAARPSASASAMRRSVKVVRRAVRPSMRAVWRFIQTAPSAVRATALLSRESMMTWRMLFASEMAETPIASAYI